MLTITNGINTFGVTRGAFEGIYKHQGYRIVGKGKEVQSAPVVDTIPPVSSRTTDPDEEEDVADEFAALLEKPIGQWNKEEVKAFAEAKGIDLAGTKNVNEAKERIQAFLAE